MKMLLLISVNKVVLMFGRSDLSSVGPAGTHLAPKIPFNEIQSPNG